MSFGTPRQRALAGAPTRRASAPVVTQPLRSTPLEQPAQFGTPRQRQLAGFPRRAPTPPRRQAQPTPAIAPQLLPPTIIIYTNVGPEPAMGPEGQSGQNVIITGTFGVSKTPADLPENGYIPTNWDAPGSPDVGYQMQPGQGLYYTVDQHTWVFVQDGSSTGWIDVGGAQGPVGPEGPAGPPGPPFTGPIDGGSF